MKTVTVKQMMKFGPCDEYPESRVRELWSGKRSLTPLQISELDIPEIDRVWALCRILDPDIRTRWLNMIVERAIRNYVLECGIPKVENWGRNWISGTDRSSAAEAAEAAAWAAVDVAARAAAAVEAAAAVWETMTMARVAAADVAWTTRAAERKQQIQDIQNILKGDENENEKFYRTSN